MEKRSSPLLFPNIWHHNPPYATFLLGHFNGGLLELLFIARDVNLFLVGSVRLQKRKSITLLDASEQLDSLREGSLSTFMHWRVRLEKEYC